MNILINIDRSFVMPAVVMLKSLELHHPGEKIRVFVLHSGLAEDDRKAFDDNFHGRLAFSFIRVTDPMFDELLVSGHVSKEAYFRVFAFSYLPDDIDRILYMDVDLIVNKGLKEFYDQNLGDAFFAAFESAAESHRAVRIYRNLNMNLKDPYFNSGTILFHIAKMKRTAGLKDSLSSYIAKNRDRLLFHDQDALNGFFYHKPVKIVSPGIYNCIVPSVLTRGERDYARKNAAILHFADRWKPWNYDYSGYFDDLFWEYARQTTYGGSYEDYLKNHSRWKAARELYVRRLKRAAKKILRKS